MLKPILKKKFTVEDAVYSSKQKAVKANKAKSDSITDNLFDG